LRPNGAPAALLGLRIGQAIRCAERLAFITVWPATHTWEQARQAPSHRYRQGRNSRRAGLSHPWPVSDPPRTVKPQQQMLIGQARFHGVDF